MAILAPASCERPSNGPIFTPASSVTGWPPSQAPAIAGAWLGGHPVTLLAGVKIGPLLGLSHDAGARIAILHKWLGDIVLGLAGIQKSEERRAGKEGKSPWS